MPPSASPDGPNWRNSLAICAVMKDEQLEDVQEWLRYYRCALACTARFWRARLDHAGILLDGQLRCRGRFAAVAVAGLASTRVSP